MRERTRDWLVGVGMLALVGSTGCLGLKPQPDPARFYVLDMAPGMAPAAAAVGELPDEAVLPLYLTRVGVTEYLDQPALAFRRGEARIEYSAVHYWAEPVRDGVTRVLRDELGRRLGEARMHPVSHRRPVGAHIEVQVVLSRFDLETGGEAVLAARWQVVRQPEGSTLATGQSTHRESFVAGAKDWGSAVTALGRCVHALAEQLVSTLGAQ
jgi:uncharacterized protein